MSPAPNDISEDVLIDASQMQRKAWARPELDAAAHARATLISMAGWIKHWRDDAECRLPCTMESLASAEAEICAALEILNADVLAGIGQRRAA